MKVYLVIIEDRHTDVQVEVYATADAALGRAVAVAVVDRERHAYGYEPEEGDDDYDGSALMFYASTSWEGDCVRVEEAEVKN
jgi:hypothetical protein